MKKFLPIILFVVGLLVVIGAVFVVKSRNNVTIDEDSDQLAQIPVDQRPNISLTPMFDLKPRSGLWLRLVIEDIKVDNAASLDYDLFYFLESGRQNGVRASVELANQTRMERDIYLGSESNGKFSQEKDVRRGTLTVKFRDKGGKVIGKLSTDFTLDETADGPSVTINSSSK